MTTATTPICFICQDQDADEPLISSPCGQCRMHVHPSCFDEHQMHQYKNQQCVMMATTNGNTADDLGFIVYTACSVCKGRYEYKSKKLVARISHHLNVYGNNEMQDRDTGHRYATVCTQFVCSLIAQVPEEIRQDALLATQTVVRSLAIATEDSIVPRIKNAFRAFKVSLYTGALAVGIGSLLLAKNSIELLFY